jgi:nitroreductase
MELLSVDQDKLIELASFAPSGHNTQPVNWLVIYFLGKT